MKGAINNIMSLLIFLMLSNIAYAATIHGTIYDLYLDKASDVIVEINTASKQQYVSKNSTYAFEVPAGDYKIRAEQRVKGLLEASTEENITVKEEGIYVLDLILFPSFDDENQLANESIEVPPTFENKNYWIYFIGVIVLILIVLSVVFYYKKIKKSGKETEKIAEESKPSDLDQLVKIIKKEGGRTTQKDLRKQIPLSEAKISLMIAELEDKGVVKKIKKGRGNIIILK